MKSKIIFIGFAVTVCLFACNVAPPSVQSPKPTLELSFQKDYQFTEVEQPKVSKVLKAQLDTSGTGTAVAASSFWDIVKDNWGALLMAFLALIEVIIRLTPTQSDNSIFNLLKKILDAIIPNQAKRGELHP